MTLIWRIQSGPIILRATTCLFFWVTLLFAEWAWISPYFPNQSHYPPVPPP